MWLAFREKSTKRETGSCRSISRHGLSCFSETFEKGTKAPIVSALFFRREGPWRTVTRFLFFPASNFKLCRIPPFDRQWASYSSTAKILLALACSVFPSLLRRRKKEFLGKINYSTDFLCAPSKWPTSKDVSRNLLLIPTEIWLSNGHSFFMQHLP